MIQKLMPARGAFGPTLAYALREEKGYVLDTHLLVADGSDPKAVAAELQQVRDQLNPRVDKPTFHVALRLPPGESLSDAQWREAAHSYMRALGYGNAPYLVVRHTDQPTGDHIHIVGSRVALDGKRVADFQEQKRGLAEVARLEQRYGLTAVASRGAATLSETVGQRSATAAELHASHRRQVPSFRADLQEQLNVALRGRPSFGEFLDRLDRAKIQLSVTTGKDGRIRGVSYELGGHHFSGTSLGRRYTWSALERQHRVTPATPEDRLRLEAHLASRPALAPHWSPDALARLDRELGRLAKDRVGTASRQSGRGEAARARAALRRDSSSALSGLASAAEVVRAVRSPVALAAAAARAARHPHLASSIQLLAAARSPETLAIVLARRGAQAAYRAGLEAAGLAATAVTRAAQRRFERMLAGRPEGHAAVAERRTVASVLRAYVRAANADNPSSEVLRERLAGAGITLHHGPRDQAILRVAGHDMPARELGARPARALRAALPAPVEQSPLTAARGTLLAPYDVARLAPRERTPALVKAHLAALGDRPVSLRVVFPDGRAELRKDWTPGQVEHAIPWLRAANAQGAAVRVTSADAEVVTLSGVTSAALSRAERRGWTPVAVVSRSEDRHDVWLRLATPEGDHGPMARQRLEQLARADFGLPLDRKPGDLGEGHLAGFSLRDPQREEPLYPRLSLGHPGAGDPVRDLGEQVRRELSQRQEAVAQRCLAARLPTPDALRSLDRFANQPGLADSTWARLALRRGLDPAEVHQALVLRGARSLDGANVAQEYALRQLTSALGNVRNLSVQQAATLALNAASAATTALRASYEALAWVKNTVLRHGLTHGDS